MSQVTVWPAAGLTVYAEDVVTVMPTSGAIVTLTSYYETQLRLGRLLTYDPLGTGGTPIEIPDAPGAVATTSIALTLEDGVIVDARLASAAVVVVSATAPRTVTGVQRISGQTPHVLWINASAYAHTFQHESLSASAADRIVTPGAPSTYVLSAGRSMQTVVDSVAGRTRIAGVHAQTSASADVASANAQLLSTALDARVGSTGQRVSTVGRGVPGDGGHGAFRWVPIADAGGIVRDAGRVWGTTGQGFWVSTADKSVIRAAEYLGAPSPIGTALLSTVDVTTQFTALIAACVPYQTTVLFPGGSYGTTQELDPGIGYTWKANGGRGKGSGSNAGGRTRIVWLGGSSHGSIGRVNRESELDGFHFFVAQPTAFVRSALVYRGNGVSAPTGGRIRRCAAWGKNGPSVGDFVYGLIVGEDETGNCDVLTMQDNTFASIRRADIWLAGGEPYNTKLESCTFSGDQRASLEGYGFADGYAQCWGTAVMSTALSQDVIYDASCNFSYKERITEIWRLAARNGGAATNFATSDVNTSTHAITSTHGLSDGDPVMVSSTGTLPSPLRARTIYFANVTSSTTFELHVTPELDMRVDFTSQGSGTHSFVAPGFDGAPQSVQFKAPDSEWCKQLVWTNLQFLNGITRLEFMGGRFSLAASRPSRNHPGDGNVMTFLHGGSITGFAEITDADALSCHLRVACNTLVDFTADTSSEYFVRRDAAPAGVKSGGTYLRLRVKYAGGAVDAQGLSHRAVEFAGCENPSRSVVVDGSVSTFRVDLQAPEVSNDYQVSFPLIEVVAGSPDSGALNAPAVSNKSASGYDVTLGAAPGTSADSVRVVCQHSLSSRSGDGVLPRYERVGDSATVRGTASGTTAGLPGSASAFWVGALFRVGAAFPALRENRMFEHSDSGGLSWTLLFSASNSVRAYFAPTFGTAVFPSLGDVQNRVCGLVATYDGTQITTWFNRVEMGSVVGSFVPRNVAGSRTTFGCSLQDPTKFADEVGILGGGGGAFLPTDDEVRAWFDNAKAFQSPRPIAGKTDRMWALTGASSVADAMGSGNAITTVSGSALTIAGIVPRFAW